MELDGRVAIITRGTSEIAIALAEHFSMLGSIVILSDKNENELMKKANEIEAIGISADVSSRADMKNLIEKTIHRFGRVDLFISNASFAGFGNVFSSEKDWIRGWQSDVMAQMYAAKYVLPQMIRQRNGYLLNMIPTSGLFTEFRTELFSTLTHPSLSFAKRMATIYRQAGIKVSVFCSNLFSIDCTAPFVKTPPHIEKLRQLTDRIVAGMHQEQFMILPDMPKTESYPIQISNSA